jgi:hypothetical protein
VVVTDDEFASMGSRPRRLRGAARLACPVGTAAAYPSRQGAGSRFAHARAGARQAPTEPVQYAPHHAGATANTTS